MPVSLSIRLLPIKSLLPLLLTVAFVSPSIFDALAADSDDDDDDDLLLPIRPFGSSALGELVAGVDGDSDVNVVVVSLTGAVVGDGVAVKSLGFVPIVAAFVNKLLSSDNIDCNILPLLIPLFAGRSHTSSDFADFCERRQMRHRNERKD